MLQQANAQGQTVVGPAGDSGATDCDFDTYPAVDGLAVDFPGSSPFATSAGGSMFNEGSRTHWNSNSSSSVNNAGSALSYIPKPRGMKPASPMALVPVAEASAFTSRNPTAGRYR